MHRSWNQKKCLCLIVPLLPITLQADWPNKASLECKSIFYMYMYLFLITYIFHLEVSFPSFFWYRFFFQSFFLWFAICLVIKIWPVQFRIIITFFCFNPIIRLFLARTVYNILHIGSSLKNLVKSENRVFQESSSWNSLLRPFDEIFLPQIFSSNVSFYNCYNCKQSFDENFWRQIHSRAYIFHIWWIIRYLADGDDVGDGDGERYYPAQHL